MTDAPPLRLGLVGDNIAASRAPLLHRLAGQQAGLAVRYDLLVPPALGQDFDAVFAGCAAGGYRGINVTYPYKEVVVGHVSVDDPLVAAIGAVNTVLFEADGPRGHNTDFTGFIAAYRRMRGQAPPGVVTIIGSGGVGRAVAFALARLGAAELRLVDRDPARAAALAEALRQGAPGTDVSPWADAVQAARGAAGLANCTPIGMHGQPGTVLPRAAMRGAAWAFDAVYTPADTPFLQDAAAEGLALVPGWELFFFQGVHAWDHFAGLPLDQAALRRALLKDAADHAAPR